METGGGFLHSIIKGGSMKNSLVVFFIFLIPLLLWGEEKIDIDSLIISVKLEQQEALNNGDSDAFKTVGSKLERMLTFEERLWLIEYYQAYNFYRVSNLIEEKEEKENYIMEAKKHIEKSIEENSEFSESHALYSSILGLEIGIKPYLGMKNGIKSAEEIKKAHALDPANPRTFLIEGISALYTPKLFGGGIDKSLEKLTKAEQLFVSQKKETGIYPDWGWDTIYIWLGMAYGKKGETDRERDYYKKALEVNPLNGWAKELLKE
jgi:tetratricopeptide (TPR) repeat protein